jgi:hypothetical protein
MRCEFEQVEFVERGEPWQEAVKQERDGRAGFCYFFLAC